MPPFWTLSAAGFLATAVTFGPARMGFGLFLPTLSQRFDLPASTVGLISSLGFLGFLLGLLASYPMTARRGPRLPVVVGLAAATLGMGLAATAQGLPALASGVCLAMSSSGFTWAPFNNAVSRRVADARRPAALAAVSTGTSVGVAGAGAAALALAVGGMSWRVAWAGFAAAGALALLANLGALRAVAGDGGPASPKPWSALATPAAAPLYAVALSFGATTAVFIAFAADRVAQAGGPGVAADLGPALLWLTYGLCGLAGLATGRLKAALGLRALLRLLLAVSTLSLALLALAPGSAAGALAAAGLQGVFVMVTSAVMAFWSARLFPDLPSLAFTAALLASAVGGVLGPALAGWAIEAFGPRAMFLATAAASAATALALPANGVRERAA